MDLGKEEQHWFEDLSHDPAYAKTILHSAQVYFDVVKRQTFGPTVVMHMNMAIILQRKRLAATSLTIIDSIIFFVLALAMFSEALDDLEVAKKHLHGLYQLIKLRGGVAALDEKHSLQIKCCRFAPSCQGTRSFC